MGGMPGGMMGGMDPMMGGMAGGMGGMDHDGRYGRRYDGWHGLHDGWCVWT